jgi:histone methylation protein DOT1
VFNIYTSDRFKSLLRIKKFLSSLPPSVLNGDDITLPSGPIRKMFDFAGLSNSDIFYHLGCGSSESIRIACTEYKVRKSIGIEINKETAKVAREKIKNLKNAQIINEDFKKTNLSDATVIFFWFTDDKLIKMMIKKFERELRDGVRILTIWSPPDLMIPSKTEFPFMLCQKPFKYAQEVAEQVTAICGSPCIDFTSSWYLAERYIHNLESVEEKYLRFVNIFQCMVIWINAWNSGVACEEEIPPPVEAYVGILKTFYNIDLSSMITKK